MLYEVGRVNRQAGDLEQAKMHLEESLRMERSLHGHAEHCDVAFLLYEVGRVNWQAGDLEQAKMHLEESLRMHRSLYRWKDNPGTAATLHALGLLCRQTGDLMRAKQQLQESLRIQRSLGRDSTNPDMAATMDALGGISRVERMGFWRNAWRSPFECGRLHCMSTLGLACAPVQCLIPNLISLLNAYRNEFGRWKDGWIRGCSGDSFEVQGVKLACFSLIFVFLCLLGRKKPARISNPTVLSPQIMCSEASLAQRKRRFSCWTWNFPATSWIVCRVSVFLDTSMVSTSFFLRLMRWYYP